MTITEHAAAALARARSAGAPDPARETTHTRRARARMTREVAVMLGAHPAQVVATADPARSHAGVHGHLFTVHDPDDTRAPFRFVPEPGQDSLYLLLDECPGCGGEVPMASVAGLADLGLYLEYNRPFGPAEPDPDDSDDRPEVAVEFFDDPGHRTGCGLGCTVVP